MTAWTWVPIAAAYVIHDRQIARHGGAAGVRDRTLLEAAFSRPMHKAGYEEGSDIFTLAAAYAFGIAKAHAFTDGNKRTAFVVAVTFLRLNGFEFRPAAEHGVAMMEGIATGGVSEAAFAEWLRTESQEL